MDIEAIFRQRDIAKAKAELAQLERFAAKRSSFLDGLDFREITPNQAFAIHERSDIIDETLGFADLYLAHLADMDQLALDLARPLAA